MYIYIQRVLHRKVSDWDVTIEWDLKLAGWIRDSCVFSTLSD